MLNRQKMPSRSYTMLPAWTTTCERMDRDANCMRLWNISFSIFPSNPNLILLLSNDMYPGSWYSCWPIEAESAVLFPPDSGSAVLFCHRMLSRPAASTRARPRRGWLDLDGHGDHLALPIAVSRLKVTEILSARAWGRSPLVRGAQVAPRSGERRRGGACPRRM